MKIVVVNARSNLGGLRTSEDAAATLASLIAVGNPMGPPASTLGCGAVATVPCAGGGAVAVGPVAAGQVYCSASSVAAAVKPQPTSNGYVAMAPRPPSQAAMPATLLPQVGDTRPLLQGRTNNRGT